MFMANRQLVNTRLLQFQGCRSSVISFGNDSNGPIFLSIVTSCLNKKLLFPTVSSQVSFDLTNQAETDTFPLLAGQRGGRSSLKKQWSKRC